VAALVVLATASASMAAVPPMKTASERQVSLRKEAGGKKIDVAVTVTAGELTSHTEPGVALGGDKSLAFGSDALLAWKVLSVLLTSEDPISDLQEHIGRVDASRAGIETLDGQFVYVWGNGPTIALSRDLARIRRITATSGNVNWEFRLSGELDLAGLPARVHILRSGEPFASVELAVAEGSGSE
jgi:hypothetical protein